MKEATYTQPDSLLSGVMEDFFSFPQSHPRHFNIGGHALDLSFCGQMDTSFFTDALEHLEEDQGRQDALRLCVIDVKTTGRHIPAALWEWPSVDAFNGDMKGLPERYYGNCNTITGTFILIDFKSARAIFWIYDVATLPEYERSFPFRHILYFWLRQTRFVLVHGGIVGRENGGALLAGKGGSGKSTATLACLDSDLFYAGDDFALLDTGSNYAHSLFNVAKLEEHNFSRFPHLVRHIANRESLPKEKGQLFIHRFLPEKLIKGFPLKALLLPRYTGMKETRYRPATEAEAMKALAPSSIWILRSDVLQLSKIARLVRTTPCYWLETGTDLPDIPSKITEILEINNSAHASH